LTYVDCGEQGSLKAVVSNRNVLETQQAVDEQGLESSQELPSVELRILTTVRLGFTDCQRLAPTSAKIFSCSSRINFHTRFLFDSVRDLNKWTRPTQVIRACLLTDDQHKGHSS
jgi:hypothetical protein